MEADIKSIVVGWLVLSLTPAVNTKQSVVANFSREVE